MGAHRRNRTIAQKQERAKSTREARFRRKKEEDRDPELRRQRVARNQPVTLDQKRVYDDIDDDALTTSVNLEHLLKKRRIQQDEDAEKEDLAAARAAEGADQDDDADDDMDSMLGSDDEGTDEDGDEDLAAKARAKRIIRDDSLAPSTTSTNLDITPESLMTRFPSLFSDDRPKEPKILITTTLNSNLHQVAEIFTNIIPNSQYIRRTAHKYGHKYSVREIASFATNRGFTSLMILREDQKKPIGIDVVDLIGGTTFHFSISSWVEGKKLPGHGNATNHYPELLLNNFSTPLGLLTAKILQTLFPATPELAGRQCVMFHNQRDYIFFRRHRYIIRDKRATEKSVVGADGKELKGVENIRAGLQELGPRFTLKLRRIDKGIGRAGSDQNDPLHWEWKAKMEKNRKRFNL
ncbi:Brix-domain-containing protein [Xylariaceae sp. FL1019]|nr:Brix-domain-containing protein [Xylariaceae sp. FL1019]